MENNNMNEWEEGIREEICVLCSTHIGECYRDCYSDFPESIIALLKREIKEAVMEIVDGTIVPDSSILCFKPKWLREILKKRGIKEIQDNE